MATEIEKKFFIKTLPDLTKYSKVGIKQWYITNKNDSILNRLRLYDDGRCIFEIKQGGFNIREEIGFEANFDEFEDMIKYKPYLEKDRYLIEDSESLEIILDVFKGNLEGIYVLEVEGKGDDGFNEVFNWESPWDWVGDEIKDTNYSGFKLAEKNMINKKDTTKLTKIVNDVIREDFRKEAMEIVKHMDDEFSSEMIMYYDDDNRNAVCMHFDYIKQQLVKKGIMKLDENDNFGHPFEIN
jgi:adenylate cyclase